jgi:transcriptional regulator with XRE-family HTH domain
MPKNLAIRRRLAATLRRWRLKRNMTQERLAERAASSSKHISEIERGDVDVGIDTLARIAKALSVDVTDLFGPPPSSAEEQPEVLTPAERAHLEETIRILRRVMQVRA